MVPEFNRNYQRMLKRRSFGYVLLYGVILLALAVGAMIWGGSTEVDVFGSMDGRFESDIVLSYDGKTLHYRENEITNYLLIGIDREELDTNSHEGGGQADFLLVLSVDRRNRTITPVMIDRDTMTPVTTYGIFGNAAGKRTMQICLAQAYSGSKVSGSDNTARAVSEVLHGVRIDRCLAMDLEGIALLNDAVGGVTVTVEDDLTALDPMLKRGLTVRLQGGLAEKFVRGRMTVADGTNASRMRRQQVYLDALVARMGEQFSEDEDFLKDVFETLSGHVESDVAMNVLLGEANAYGKYAWMPLKTMPGDHRMGEDGFAEYWVNEPMATELVAGIWFD